MLINLIRAMHYEHSRAGRQQVRWGEYRLCAQKQEVTQTQEHREIPVCLGMKAKKTFPVLSLGQRHEVTNVCPVRRVHCCTFAMRHCCSLISTSFQSSSSSNQPMGSSSDCAGSFTLQGQTEPVGRQPARIRYYSACTLPHKCVSNSGLPLCKLYFQT